MNGSIIKTTAVTNLTWHLSPCPSLQVRPLDPSLSQGVQAVTPPHTNATLWLVRGWTSRDVLTPSWTFTFKRRGNILNVRRLKIIQRNCISMLQNQTTTNQITTTTGYANHMDWQIKQRLYLSIKTRHQTVSELQTGGKSQTLSYRVEGCFGG